MPQPAADRNLLFGIVALQMDFIGRDALIAAMNAWVLNKAKPLGQVLLEQGALSATDRQLLEGLVQRHLEKHGHDAERSLAALAGPPAVQAQLRRLVDPEGTASVAPLSATPSAPSEAPAALATTAPASSPGCRFQILRPHASGGLGEVFVARDGELSREVALKEIQPQYAHHAESRARFVREAEITGGLEHPGIVPVYGLGQYADGRPYYAMRFIRGDSLKEAIERFHASSTDPRQRNLELRQLLGRFIAVCNAIAYAHSRGVIHRDLKPANIMLGEFGETLVVDWGLAKTTAGGPAAAAPQGKEPHLEITTDAAPAPTDSELTRTGQALGTPAYMSPEQAAGRLEQLGPASDVYSLGATLYSLVTGQAPFARSNVGEVLNKVQKGDFPPPRQVNAQVPAALEAICLKAMALEPQARYPSAQALADDLEHWLADEAVTAHPEAWPARLARWARQHRGLVGSAAAVVTVALTVAIAAWLVNEADQRQQKEQVLRGVAEEKQAEADGHRQEAEAQRQRADRYLYFSRINLAHQAWQEAHITRMDELLEQTQPQQMGGEDLAGFERGYLLRLRQTSLFTFRRHAASVRCVAFSPAGGRLASSGVDRAVKVWDGCTGKEGFTLTGHRGTVWSVAFSPDGDRLASASDDRTVKVWDMRSGQEKLTLRGHLGTVFGVAFSPDGRRLASASFDGTVKVWEAFTGKEGLTLKGHSGNVASVAFSPDGRRIASAGNDRAVKLWDAHTGQEVLTLRGGTGFNWTVAFSPDGRHIASAGDDRAVRVWDAHTGQEGLTLKGHTGRVWSVAFSPDGGRLSSAAEDRTVRVWDVGSGQQRLTLKGHLDYVFGVAFSPDGSRLASAGLDQTVKVWDARTDQESDILRGHSLLGHSLAVWGVAFSPDGRRLASAGLDQTVKVWDTSTGQESLAFRGHSLPVMGVAFSPDGRRIASAGEDRTVMVWDASTGREDLILKGHGDGVRGVAFSPDGQRLASASEDGTVKVWDTSTGKERLTFKGHLRPVFAVAFSPDGRLIASAGEEQTVKVWDASTGREGLTLKGHSLPVQGVAFSGDGRWIASASSDMTVKVWDASTGQESRTLRGHTGRVNGVAFSPDGRRLASASVDGTVKVWDASTGQEGLTLQGHAGILPSVAFSPDGRRIAAGLEGGVKVWDAGPPDPGPERQARSYFRFLAETVVLKDDMIQQIRRTPTLSEPVREQALAFARAYREAPSRLNEVSWSVVSGSQAAPGAYALALRQAEAACRHEPENGIFLTTLGAAQYRSRQDAAARETLTRADKLNAARFQRSLPPDLAFLAMTQHRLGHKAAAAATLGRLRDTLKHGTFDREFEDLLQEAERVMDARK